MTLVRDVSAKAAGWAVSHLRNPRAAPRSASFPAGLPLRPAESSRAHRAIEGWRGYAPSPLRAAPASRARVQGAACVITSVARPRCVPSLNGAACVPALRAWRPRLRN